MPSVAAYTNTNFLLTVLCGSRQIHRVYIYWLPNVAAHTQTSYWYAQCGCIHKHTLSTDCSMWLQTDTQSIYLLTAQCGCTHINTNKLLICPVWLHTHTQIFYCLLNAASDRHRDYSFTDCPMWAVHTYTLGTDCKMWLQTHKHILKKSVDYPVWIHAYAHTEIV